MGPNGSQKTKATIRADTSKSDDLCEFPSEKQARGEFKAKISTAWYPLFLEECRSAILRALAFGPNSDTKEKHLLRARMMVRYEFRKPGDDFRNMERRAATEEAIIKNATEANWELRSVSYFKHPLDLPVKSSIGSNTLYPAYQSNIR